MGTVRVFTADHMQQIEDETVNSGLVDIHGNLILTKHDGSTVDAGHVQGDKGDDGVAGAPGLALGIFVFYGGDPAAPIPAGMLELNGQIILAATYSGLAAIYPSWIHGANLILPDLRGTAGVGYKAGDTLFGTLGSIVGSQKTVIPPHRHTFAYGVLDNGSFGSGGSQAGTSTASKAGAFKYSTNDYAGGITDGSVSDTTAAGGAQTTGSKSRFKSIGDTDVASPVQGDISAVQPSYVGRWLVVAADGSGSYSPTVQAALVGRVTTLEGELGLTGTVDPYWTYGLPNVTLTFGPNSGSIVPAVITHYEPTPGDTVVLEKIGVTYYIVGPGTLVNPKFLKQIPLVGLNHWDGIYGTIEENSAINFSRNNSVTKSSTGWVLVRAMFAPNASGGTSGAIGTVIAQLPPGFRPTQDMDFKSYSSGSGAGRVIVRASTGNIELASTVATSAYISISNIQFNNMLTFTPMTLLNGWTSAGLMPAYAKDPYGVVALKGNMSGTYSNLPFWACPSGYDIDQGTMTSIGSGILDGITSSGSGVTDIRAYSAAVTGGTPKTLSNVGPGTGITYLNDLFYPAVGNTLIWQSFNMKNSWSRYNTDYGAPQYAMRPDGLLQLRGLMKGTTLNQTSFQMNEGNRSKNSILKRALGTDALALMEFFSDGTAYLASGNGSYISLDGILLAPEQ